MSNFLGSVHLAVDPKWYPEMTKDEEFAKGITEMKAQCQGVRIFF